MYKIKIWDGKEKIVFPTGEVKTASEIKHMYPASSIVAYACSDSPVNGSVFMPLESYLSAAHQYTWNNDLTPEANLKAALAPKQVTEITTE